MIPVRISNICIYRNRLRDTKEILPIWLLYKVRLYSETSITGQVRLSKSRSSPDIKIVRISNIWRPFCFYVLITGHICPDIEYI